jgi:hypothetical protein
MERLTRQFDQMSNLERAILSDFLKRDASLAAGAAVQEQIYQVQMIDEAWGDVTEAQYECGDWECKRIVYAAPVPSQAASVDDYAERLELAKALCRIVNNTGMAVWQIDAIQRAAKILSAAPQAAATVALTERRHVGDSKFESWYERYASRLTGNPKQTARDAYAAGLNEVEQERSTGRCFFCGEPMSGQHEEDCPQASPASDSQASAPEAQSVLPLTRYRINLVDGSDTPDKCGGYYRDADVHARMDDLAMLVKKLVRHVRKATPDNNMAGMAMDYLRRHGLEGSPLRAADSQDERTASPTAGMTLGERIAHVGGRTNAASYVEFGSVMAVGALIRHVLRDVRAASPADTRKGGEKS